MKWLYPLIDLELVFSEGLVDIITIESPMALSSVLEDLWNQSIGTPGKVVLSDVDKTLSFSKSTEVVINPFSIDANSSKVLKKVYQELSEEVIGDRAEQLQTVHSKMIEWLEGVLAQSPYPFTYKLELSTEEVFKLYDVKMDFQESNLAERIINYVRILHQVCGKQVFVFTNLKSFLDQTTLTGLYQSLLYEQVWIIDFESSFKPVVKGERNTILDRDLCMIHLD